MKTNQIPEYILKNYSEGVLEGQFKSYVLFADLTGFTRITGELMKHSKEGAEILSDILLRVFTPMIQAVYERHGFISTFAGDAFTAVFPLNRCSRTDVSEAEFNLREAVVKQSYQKTKYGAFRIKIKTAKASGTIQWKIVEAILSDGRKRNAYYFSGDAIEKCIKALASNAFKDSDNGFFPDGRSDDRSGSYGQDQRGVRKDATQADIEPGLLRDFFDDRMLSTKLTGEFRRVVSVFISIGNHVEEVIRDSIILSEKYGGYLNKVDFSDKGYVLLCIFGAPVSHERDLQRALAFSLELRKRHPSEIRAGLTSGVAYWGRVGSQQRLEYTVLGDKVNLSARLMMSEDYSKIVISDFIAKKVSRTHEVQFKCEKAIKGFKKSVKIYELIGKKEKRFKGQAFKDPLDFRKNTREIVAQKRFIGRKNEISRLNDKITAIRTGSSEGVLYLYGEPGMGKSRLVDEVFKQNETTGINFITLQCDGILKKSMNPFKTFFRNFFHQSSEDSEAQNKMAFDQSFDTFLNAVKRADHSSSKILSRNLNRTRSFLAALVELYSEDSLYQQLEPKLRFENTVMAVTDFFKGMSLIRPLFLFIEDLHWMDTDSKRILRDLSNDLRHYRILPVISSRYNDDGTKPSLSLNPDLPTEEMTLEKVTDEDLAELVKSNLTKRPDDQLLEFIREKSENNPFYIEQYCHYLRENDLLETEVLNGVEQIRLLKRDIEIPGDIQSIIIARIDRLSNELKEIVQFASVLGRESEIRVLNAMIGLYRNAVETNTAKPENKTPEAFPSIKKQMAQIENEQVWTIFSEIKYLFNHALLRDAVYEMQLRKRLKQLHHVAAQTIEHLHHDNLTPVLTELANHYEKAGDEAQAIVYLKKAIVFSKEKYENETALKHLDILIQLLEKGGQDEKRVEPLIDRGYLMQMVGDWKGATESYMKAKAICEKNNDRKQLGIVCGYLGEQYYIKGDYQSSIEMLEKKLEISKALNDELELSRAYNYLAVVNGYMGKYDLAMTYYQKRLDFAILYGDKQELGAAYGYMGIVYRIRGEYEQAENCYHQAIQLFEAIRYTRGKAIALGNLGMVYVDTNRFEEAMEKFREDLEISEEIGDKREKGIALGHMGIVYLMNYDYKNALRCYRGNLEISRSLGDKRGIAITLGGIGRIHMDRGEYEQALNCFQQNLEISRSLKDRRGIAISLSCIAKYHMHSKDTTTARKLLSEAITINTEIRNMRYLPYDYYDMAEIELSESNFQEALRMNEKAEEASQALKDSDETLLCRIQNIRIQIKAEKSESAIQKRLLDLSKLKAETGKEELIRLIGYDYLTLSGNRLDETERMKLKEALLAYYRKQYQKTSNIKCKEKIKRLEEI